MTTGQWLTNKRIVVIGGTTGLGLSAAKAFVAQGAQVVVVGRDRANCLKAEKSLLGRGIGVTGDAREPDTAVKAIVLCQQSFGSFDGLYHVAGGSGRRMGDGPLHELTTDGWNKTLELNLTSMMLSNQAAVKAFVTQRNGGSILNMDRYWAMHCQITQRMPMLRRNRRYSDFPVDSSVLRQSQYQGQRGLRTWWRLPCRSVRPR